MQKKKGIIILTSVFSMFFVNCEDEKTIINKDIMEFSKFPEKDSLFFENVFEFKEGASEKLHLIDSNLVICNTDKNNSSSFFYNYSLSNNQLSKGYINKGRGPGEFIGGATSGVIDGNLWVYDVVLKKIILLNKLKKANDTLNFKEYPVRKFYYKIDFKDIDNFYAVGSFDSEFKIQEIDLITGIENTEFGAFDYVPKKTPLSVLKSAHESFIYVNKLSDKIVLAYRFADVIEIFDRKIKESKVIHGPEIFDVDYNTMSLGDNMYVMGVTDKTRRTFVNGTVTDKYIYLAYSGNLFNSINSSFSSCIYVYDWNGNPIKKLILDKAISALVVDNDNNTMYAYDGYTGFIVKTNINIEEKTR